MDDSPISHMGSFDAAVWARAFMRDFGARRGQITEEIMHSWFANAIMRGYDEHAHRYPLGEKV